MKTFCKMLKTELKLSLRGMDMFIFAICMPLIVLIILGVIYGNKAAFEGAGYTFFEQSFSAVTTISICAGGVMGLPLVISEYRSKNILKRFKVTPIRPVIILLVQVVIYALYSFVSLITLLFVAVIFFDYKMCGSLIYFIAAYLLVMLTMFSIGLMVGGISKNTKTASIIASILYFPMLIFSGTTVPFEIMPKALQNMVGVLPLTQGIKFLKAASLGLPFDNVILPGTLLLIISAICIIISLKYFKWE